MEVSDTDEFAENRLKAVYNLTHVRLSFASRGRHYTITAEEGRRSAFFREESTCCAAAPPGLQ